MPRLAETTAPCGAPRLPLRSMCPSFPRDHPNLQPLCDEAQDALVRDPVLQESAGTIRGSWRGKEALDVCVEHPVHIFPLRPSMEGVQRIVQGATENAATVQVVDRYSGLARQLYLAVPRLFIIDGAKALSKAIRRTFGRAAAIQRLLRFTRRATSRRSDRPSRCTPSARRASRQAWRTGRRRQGREGLLRNLAQRLERDRSGSRWLDLKASTKSSPSRALARHPDHRRYKSDRPRTVIRRSIVVERSR